MFLDDKPQGEIAEAPAKTLKLSAAIRIGAAKRPQCTGRMFSDGKSCALGAAYEALFGYPGDGDGQEDVYRWQSWLQAKLEKAIARPFPNPVQSIGNRNDNGWSREQIADWLEAQGF